MKKGMAAFQRVSQVLSARRSARRTGEFDGILAPSRLFSNTEMKIYRMWKKRVVYFQTLHMEKKEFAFRKKQTTIPIKNDDAARELRYARTRPEMS